ncbi:MAG: NAD-dependent epimerase/dehydratase family protein [Anaerolineae bacterium]
MREKVILITGANGEIGHGLIRQLAAQPDAPGIVVLDIRNLDASMMPLVSRAITGDILDTELLDTLINEYEIETIYHLAALLSSHSEFHPEAAHRVNVQGTVNLLKLAIDQGESRGKPVKFIYPSSIAVYGLPDLRTKQDMGAVREEDYLYPTTMYGANKLYCEHLGRYYAQHYKQLSAGHSLGLDFRCVRFPGIISAITMPSGGTSDYAPEMIHAAAQGKPYTSFVREDTIIPFMVMPDATKALLTLSAAPRDRLTRHVYNVTSFSLSAAEFADYVQQYFPQAQIAFNPTPARQGIVDTWPAFVTDERARRDWGWQPDYDLHQAFDDYLIPTITRQYHYS